MKSRQGIEADSGILYNLKVDKAYRRRFVLTLSVFWSYVILGWSVLQIGTALPDLQQLVAIDLETAAWIFTVWSVGFMVGSLVSGWLFDRYNRLVIMMVNTIGMSACCFSVPYCKHVAILLTIRVFSGFFAGGVDTGANTIVPTIWGSKDGQSFMQAMYLAYTLGGIFSPLATKPFMANSYNNIDITHVDPRSGNGAITTASTQLNADNRNSSVELTSVNRDTSILNRSKDLGVTMLGDDMFNDSFAFVNYTTNGNHNVSMNFDKYYTTKTTEIANEDLTGTGETMIHFAFIMSGLIVLSGAVPYAIMALLGNYDEREPPDGQPVQPETEILANTNHVVTTEQNQNGVSKGRKLWLICFVASVNFLYSAIEDSLGDFLTTYCLFYLQWTKTDSVALMSFYWVTSCFGGVVGIFLIKRLGPAKLLFLAFAIWNTCFLVLVLGSMTKYATLTWIGFLGAGFAMVQVIPAIISWTNENVCEITGKVSSVFLFSSGFGIAANPKFIGYMMEEYSYGNFVYILMCETFVCMLLFVCAIAIFSCRKGNDDRSDVTNEKC